MLAILLTGVFLASSEIIYDQASAANCSVTPIPMTLSKQVCGDTLCDQPMTTEEKLGYYLLTFIELDEGTVIQQSRFQIAGVTQQAFRTAIGSFESGIMVGSLPQDSLIDRGRAASLVVPIEIPGGAEVTSIQPEIAAAAPNLRMQPSSGITVQVPANSQNPQFSISEIQDQLVVRGFGNLNPNIIFNTIDNAGILATKLDRSNLFVGIDNVENPRLYVNADSYRNILIDNQYSAIQTPWTNTDSLEIIIANSFDDKYVVQIDPHLADIFQLDQPFAYQLESSGAVISRNACNFFPLLCQPELPYSKFLETDARARGHCSNCALGSIDSIETDNDGLIYLYHRSFGNDGKIRVYDQNGERLFEFGADELSSVGGIAVSDTGRIYVSDYSEDKIVAFDSNGNFLFEFGTNGNGNGQFDNPESLEVDSNGRLYVSDTYNRRVQVFDADGNFEYEISPSGSWQNGHAPTLE